VATTRANRTLDYPVMTGGWGLYAEELALRRGYAASDPKVRIAMLVDPHPGGLRLIAQVRIHVEADAARGRGGLPEEQGLLVAS